eukprot:m51a1_g7242 hypothetical protein (486) ;mRNA; r:111256-113941
MGCPHHSHLAALLLACACAVGSSAVGADQCTGAGAEIHDHGTDYHTRNVVGDTASSGQPLCPQGGDSYSGTFAQLFTPPSVPWKYTRVCFALLIKPLKSDRALPQSALVHGEVSLYAVSVGRALGGALLPLERLAVAPFVLRLDYEPRTPGAPKGSDNGVVPVWLSVDVSNNSAMVAWDKGVFVSVSFRSCESVYYVTAYSQLEQRLVLSGGVPQGWYCNASRYHDGNCDCNCGAGDVDCNTNFTSDCPPGSVCDPTGLCVEVDWEERGLCNASNYWQYDGCQCECGSVVDPDCLDSTAAVFQCSPGVSLAQPLCNFAPGDAPYCADKWTCNSSMYNDGEVCNCQCGVQDPDCANTSRDTDCPVNDFCDNNICSVPRRWACDLSWFNAKDECDCGCGVYDPDCDSTGCGNRVAEPELNESCDGGLGRKVKYGPRKLNIPVEMNSNITSIDANCVPVQDSPSLMSAGSPVVGFITPDGVVYVSARK